MTTDLTYLAYTAALTAVLWVPYIVGLLAAFKAAGVAQADTYRDPTPPEMPAWVKRCNRAHLNAVESLAPFAALVLVTHVGGVANEMTATWAVVYFFARVAHAVVHWAGIPYVRTLAFVVGLVATLGIFWEIVSFTPPA